MFLNNQQVIGEIKREIKKFVETNDNENVTTQNLWEAAKAILRGGSAGKESTCNGEDLGSISRLGRSPGEGNGFPFQYSREFHELFETP